MRAPISGASYLAGDLNGARVLVAGARVTGVSAARMLAELGAEVIVTDSSPTQLQALAGARWCAGGAIALSAGLDAPRRAPTWW